VACRESLSAVWQSVWKIPPLFWTPTFDIELSVRQTMTLVTKKIETIHSSKIVIFPSLAAREINWDCAKLRGRAIWRAISRVGIFNLISRISKLTTQLNSSVIIPQSNLIYTLHIYSQQKRHASWGKKLGVSSSLYYHAFLRLRSIFSS